MADRQRAKRGEARSAERAARSGPARGRNAEVTRAEIVNAAARHFALRGFAHVTLQDIAADADVTPALINRYFGSKRALFEVVAAAQFGHANFFPDDAADLASAMIDFWYDVQARTPAVALLRSIDIDGGILFEAELERRVRVPLREQFKDRPDTETIVRLMTSLSMGFGLFGVGTLLNGNADELSEAARAQLERKLAGMIAALFEA